MPVTPDGPHTAKLLFVGEAPGRNEMRQGIPFCGATGKIVRGVLKREGLDCEIGKSKDVRFTNVIPYNPGTIQENQRDTLVAKHWNNINEDLQRTQARVIVACGGVALRRLTGLTNIAEQQGSVIPAGDLPASLTVQTRARQTYLPSESLILPCLHPAGIMQTKIRADWIQCRAALHKACEYAKGKAYKPEIVGRDLEMVSIFWRHPQRKRAISVLQKSKVITLDTEFPPETHVPVSVQFSGDAEPKTVFWFKPEPRILAAFYGAIHGKELVAHYHPAELYSLAKVGLDLSRERWFDTLLAWATLYPDANVSLPNPVMFYTDNERNWKDRATDDPIYMAKDVRNCYRIYQAMRAELAENNMLGLFYDEVMPSMELCERMEHEGLQVDTKMQSEMLAENEHERLQILHRLHERVPYSKTMVKKTTVHLKKLVEEHDESRPVCDLHPKYDGVRGKRFAADDSCQCRLVYEWVTEKIGRETPRAFQPGNPHDLRWLLYDEWKLPKQRPAKGSKAPSTGADAIRRLTMRLELTYQEKQTKSKYYRDDTLEIVQFLQDAKHLQHLEKMASTFLRPPVDEHDVAHPPYRLWGTGTGRLAGGYDENVAAEGAVSPYSFNPLNIPKETRKLFRADDVLLGDWRKRKELCPKSAP